MNQNKNDIFRYLPTPAWAMVHIAAMVLFAVLVGPLVGPLVMGWINPTQVWGGAGVGDYSLGGIAQWGLALLMFEAFFYAGWLISRGNKGKAESDDSAWWNRQ